MASGSKVGSLKYKFMVATTNEKYCPTLREKVADSKVPAGIKAVYEIVIDGVDEKSVAAAMGAGIKAAVQVPGVKFISAGNFGGSLGPFSWILKRFFKFSFLLKKFLQSSDSINTVIAE